jgi:hypothetical protein
MDSSTKRVLQPEEHEMNAITSRMTQFTMIAAVLAACVVAQPSSAAKPEVCVVQFPTVVVVGKRIPVVQLERVVVTAKRVAPVATVVAQCGGAHGPVTATTDRG